MTRNYVRVLAATATAALLGLSGLAKAEDRVEGKETVLHTFGCYEKDHLIDILNGGATGGPEVLRRRFSIYASTLNQSGNPLCVYGKIPLVPTKMIMPIEDIELAEGIVRTLYVTKAHNPENPAVIYYVASAYRTVPAAASVESQEFDALHLDVVYVQALQVCDTDEQMLDVVVANLNGDFAAGAKVWKVYNNIKNPVTGEWVCGPTGSIPFVIKRVVGVFPGFHKRNGTIDTITVVEIALPDDTHYFAGTFRKVMERIGDGDVPKSSPPPPSRQRTAPRNRPTPLTRRAKASEGRTAPSNVTFDTTLSKAAAAHRL